MRYTRGDPPAIAGWSAVAGPVSARLGAGAPRRASPFWSSSSSSCWWGWSPRWRFPTWSGSRGPSPARPSATTSWISSRVSAARRCCDGGPTWSSGPTACRTPGAPTLRAEPRTPRRRIGALGRPGTGPGHPSFAGHDRYAIDLPEGWEIRLDEPLVVYANGLCLGAGLALYRQGEEDSADRARAAVLPRGSRCVGAGSPASAVLPRGSRCVGAGSPAFARRVPSGRAAPASVTAAPATIALGPASVNRRATVPGSALPAVSACASAFGEPALVGPAASGPGAATFCAPASARRASPCSRPWWRS